MATINRLKPGQIVYSVERTKMGNTAMTRNALYMIKIIEIDAEGQFVIASRNGNPPRKYSGRSVEMWRVKKPEPKRVSCGLPSY